MGPRARRLFDAVLQFLTRYRCPMNTAAGPEPMTEPTPDPARPAWAALMRDVPDFPKPGVVFRDICPLLADAVAFAAMLDDLAAPWRGAGIDVVAGIEARGFVLGAALARHLHAGFVPLRKPGKLPGPVIEESYALEYGTDRLQMQSHAVHAGTRVLLVDDVLATGGTLAAAAALVQRQGAVLAGAAVLMELEALGGRARWPADAALRALLRH